MSDYEQRRTWADVGRFVKERVARSSHESEDTRLECLYAHYRKWAFFRNEAPITEEVFAHRFEKVTKLQHYSFRGYRLYQAWIKDAVKVEDTNEVEAEKKPSRVVRGKVKTKRAIRFLDEVLEANTVIDWLEPSPFERREIQRLSKDEKNNSMSWLIADFNQKRRYIAAKDVERFE